jgi:threonine synthase
MTAAIPSDLQRVIDAAPEELRRALVQAQTGDDPAPWLYVSKTDAGYSIAYKPFALVALLGILDAELPEAGRVIITVESSGDTDEWSASAFSVVADVHGNIISATEAEDPTFRGGEP